MLPPGSLLLAGLPATGKSSFGNWLEQHKVSFGKRGVQVIYTPGHTSGSVSFVTDELLIAGDTLFRHSIGRTDLWGGDAALILRSIRERLFALAPDTRVMYGHGPDNTIGDEKRANPFVGDHA